MIKTIIPWTSWTSLVPERLPERFPERVPEVHGFQLHRIPAARPLLKSFQHLLAMCLEFPEWLMALMALINQWH